MLPEEKFAIFGNWKILASFHTKFSKILEATARNNPLLVSQCFLDVDFVGIYAHICCNHDQQLKMLADIQVLLQNCMVVRFSTV